MSRTNQIPIIVSLIVLSISPSFADWRENAKAIDISGGEDHTLVLTANKWPWACGPNGGPGPYYGVLGTGSTSTALIAKTLVRVWDGDMNTLSDYLEDINDVDAGWKHSLAVEGYDPNDPNYNGYVWAWGWNSEGQLGDNQDNSYESTPVQVLRGEETPADPNNPDPNLARIIAISAGRSGQHSLAVDADAYAYGWGYNKYGQCGNDESNNRKLTPVRVHRGDQPEDLNDPNNWLKHIIDICAGADQSIAVEKDDPTDPNFNGCVYTWGTNWWGDEDYEEGWIDPGYGLLGTGSNVALEDTPVKVHGVNDVNFLEHIVAVTAGWDHCLALEKDDPYDPNIYNPTYTGRVYAWGNNGRGYGGGHYAEEWEASVGGRLGDGSYDSNSTPVLVLSGEQDPSDPDSYLEHIVAISAGHWHSLAIDANGTIWTWGKGSAGRLGLGNKTIHCNTPHPIPVVYNITQETFAFAIQGAIDDANGAGDILEASPGTYYENVNLRDKSVTLRSAEPGDSNVVADTVVDAAYNSGSDYHFYQAVDFNDGSGSTLAGLTLMNAPGGGVLCEDVDSVSIVNCSIQDNADYGVEAIGECDITIERSLIEGNGKSGLYAHDGCVFLLNGSVVRKNGWDGVDLESNNSAMLTNNWIHNNGIAHYSEGWGSGIWFEDQPYVAIVRNNTIYDNWTYGIEASESGADPNIINCIISGNDSNDLYRENGDFETVNYCCLQNVRAGGLGNKTGDPGFMNIATDANDLHLDENSQCKDAGDPNASYSGESDIDGEERVINGRVDIGADEFYWSPADFSGDGIVNFVDYAMLAGAWHTEPNDANYNEDFDLEDDDFIDFADILVFCDHWLREAGWFTGPLPLMAGRGGAGMLEGLGLDAGLSAVATTERGPAIAEPIDIEAIMKWLAEIWLEPDVRKSIDEEKFLKVYESLKELSNQ